MLLNIIQHHCIFCGCIFQLLNPNLYNCISNDWMKELNWEEEANSPFRRQTSLYSWKLTALRMPNFSSLVAP